MTEDDTTTRNTSDCCGIQRRIYEELETVASKDAKFIAEINECFAKALSHPVRAHLSEEQIRDRD